MCCSKIKSNERKKLKDITNYKSQSIKTEKYYDLQREYFRLYDDYLDKALSGPDWLKDKKIANIVKEAIHFRDGKEYYLIAYTIMPTHVHIIFVPIVERDLSRSVDRHLSSINAATVERFAESLNAANKRNGVSLNI